MTALEISGLLFVLLSLLSPAAVVAGETAASTKKPATHAAAPSTPRTAAAAPALATPASSLPASTTRPPVPAKGKSAPTADPNQRAVTAEERDRLLREKKELEARVALLQKQLELSKQLVAQKEQMRKLLLEELRLLKSAP